MCNCCDFGVLEDETTAKAKEIAEHYDVDYCPCYDDMDADVVLDHEHHVQVSANEDFSKIEYTVYRFDGQAVWFLNQTPLRSLKALYNFIDNELPLIGR